MKTKLYYHVYLSDDYSSWVYPFMEQHKLMEDHGLLKEVEPTIICITQNDGRLDIFMKLLQSLNYKCNFYAHMNSHTNDQNMLQGINTSVTLTENLTMRHIYNDVMHEKEDYKLLYLHTKGITSVDNHLKKGNVDTFRNYFYWRQFLNWGVIERWQEAVRLLDSYDLVGVNYFDEPARHFSGNFWWGNSSYIKTLPDPSTMKWWKELQSQASDAWLRTAPERFRDEMWVCSNKDAKIASFKNLDKVTNLSAEIIYRKDYA